MPGLCVCSNDFCRGDDLRGMPLCVFGRVKEQPEHGRRQAMTSNLARFVQRAERRTTDLVERTIDSRLYVAHQGVGGLRLLMLLRRKRLVLRDGQRLAKCVRRQPIEAAGQMLEMKPDGGGASRACPQLSRGERRDVFDL